MNEEKRLKCEVKYTLACLEGVKAFFPDCVS